MRFTFSAADLGLQQGNGNAVFKFGLTDQEQAQFNTIRAMAGSSGFFAGLSTQPRLCGRRAAGCLVSNDGPDCFAWLCTGSGAGCWCGIAGSSYGLRRASGSGATPSAENRLIHN